MGFGDVLQDRSAFLTIAFYLVQIPYLFHSRNKSRGVPGRIPIASVELTGRGSPGLIGRHEPTAPYIGKELGPARVIHVKNTHRP